MPFRIPRVVVPFLAAAILTLSITQVAFGATSVTTTWQAKVGASGVNGTANVSTITTGAGSIGLKLVKLKASSTLPVVLYKGTCASVGAVLFRMVSITTSSTGAASRTNTLSAAQVNQILAATTGTGKVAIRVGSGTSAKCGAFVKVAVPGPQAVVQAFYDWYLAQVATGTIDLHRRPDLTQGFITWFEGYGNGSMFGADPILCAQAIPESVRAGTAAISGAQATVKITEAFAGNPPPETVKLALGPAGWQISAVHCVAG